jgi:hypothetical protein
VISSKYFSTKPYLEENKAINKRKKRPTIQAFISYLKEKKIVCEPEYLEKDAYLNTIETYFSEANLFEHIQQEKEREKYVNTIKQKYNGRIIMVLFPELKGKYLGKFMNQFQAQFDDYECYLFEMTEEEIITGLKTFYHIFKNE